MTDEQEHTPYQAGQRWAFRTNLAELEPVVILWLTEDDEAPIHWVFVELREEARVRYGVRGVVLRVTPEVLDSSVTAQLEVTELPSWLSEEHAWMPEVYYLEEYCTEGTLADALRGAVETMQSISWAIDKALPERVAQLLAEDPDLVHRPVYGEGSHQLLHCAAQEGKARVAEVLIRHGADVNARGSGGFTPLHGAADGYPEVARLLLDHGANVNARDDGRYTPLFLAVRRGGEERLAVAQLLEERGAALDLNILVCLGRTEQVRAWLTGNPDAVRQADFPDLLVVDLVRQLAETIGKCSEDPQAAAAVLAEHLPVLEMLLDQGASANYWDALYYAVQLPDTAVVRLLLEHGADPNRGADQGSYLPDCTEDPVMRAFLKQFGAKSADDPEEAVRRCTIALGEDSRDQDAYSKRATAWKQLGQYDRALADYEQAIRLAPRDPQAYSDRALIWAACPDARFRDAANAVRSARRADRLGGRGNVLLCDPDSGELFYRTEFTETLAAALAEAGAFDEAVRVLRERAAYLSGHRRDHLFALARRYQERQPLREDPVAPELARLGAQLACWADAQHAAAPPVEEAQAEEDATEEITIADDGVLKIERQDFGPAGVRQLLASPRVGSLTSLAIQSSNIRAEGARLLAEQLNAPRLTRLDLTRNRLGDAGGIALVSAPRWERLAELDLSRNHLGDATAQALAANPTLANLTVLALSPNCIRAAGARALAASPHLARLTKLELGLNFLRDEGARALAASPYLTRLTHLQLGTNWLGKAAAEALASSPILANVIDLYLGDNHLGSEGVAALAASPHVTHLTKLGLCHNKIGSPGAQALAASPALANLTELDLCHNRIDAAGASALAASPHLAKLTELLFAANPIGADGARALANSPYLKHLKELLVNEDDIGKEGADALRERFGDRVTVLDSSPCFVYPRVNKTVRGTEPVDLPARSAEEQALRAAVVADPDADAPRLAYADWLTRHGDPRGEFIRVECTLRGAWDATLAERRSELLERHEDEWVKPLQALGLELEFRGSEAIAYDRGLVDFLAVGVAGVFPEQAAALFDAAPGLRRLRLCEQTVDGVSLAASPYLARLTELNLDHTDLDDAGGLALAASPHVSRLKSLDLTSNKLTLNAILFGTAFG